MDSMTLISNKVMGKIESWRQDTGHRINSDHQITAFHLACLFEEKFRIYALMNRLPQSTTFNAHLLVRQDIFAFEWALRSLVKLHKN